MMLHPRPSASRPPTGQAGDDGVEDTNEAVDDGLQDGADAVDDGH